MCLTGAEPIPKPAPKPSKASASSLKLKDYLTDAKWKKVLEEEFTKPYFVEIENKLAQEYKAGKEVFPPKELIFNAFNLTPLDKVLFFK